MQVGRRALQFTEILETSKLHSRDGGEAPLLDHGRCRLHGGLSTGPKTSEGLERIRQAAMKHRRYTQKAKAEQRQFRELLRWSRAFFSDLNTEC